MLFSSVPFLVYFLPVTLIGALTLRRWWNVEACKLWLLGASAVFYGYWDWPYLTLLFGSIAVNFFIGRKLDLLEDGHPQRRMMFITGIAFNLGLLFVFKYFDFFINNIEFMFGFDINVFKIVLPLGISFFTFQQIAFLADSNKRKHILNYSFIDYAVFISFFPQLIAGPIVHHNDFVPQLKEKRFARPTGEMFAAGLTIIIIGLFKKSVLADGLSPTVDLMFGEAAAGATLTLLEAWLATLAFAGQIYFDFSGYSDIAVGLGLLFGLKMPENFAAPYRSTSIIDFWRRWHITLSTFLRDYLYIPLGGNRHGRARRYINLMATMLLGGLWHGAAWTFVVWGGLHGAYLAVNHLFNSVAMRMRGAERFFASRVTKLAGWALTFWAVGLAWIFFRAESFDAAMNIAAGYLGFNGVYAPPQLLAMFGMVQESFDFAAPGTSLFADKAMWNELLASTGYVLLGLAVALSQTALRGSQRGRLIIVALVVGLVIQAVFFGKASEEFIYFQF